MKKLTLVLTLVLAAMSVDAQQYNITFKLEGSTDTMLYIARHFRDEVQILDSARLKNGSYNFVGSKGLKRGVYALVHQDREKSIGDFVIDDSRKFTITADDKLTSSKVKVKGSDANQRMYNYMATVSEANKEIKEIRERKKNPDTKAAAEAEEKALMDRMDAYDKEMRHPKTPQLYFDLINLFETAQVPDSVENKAYYYRTHYWDGVFESTMPDLIYTPNLFNKLNYFFFGILYSADSDTIIKDLDRLMARVEGDTVMQRYILDFITPKYFRSTRNIGWDAVWCHIASTYYLAGRCPWLSEGTLHNTRYNYNKIKQSLIGAHGQELWMSDTTQLTDPSHWISSHRFPEKYVILWFWDPDCHHCQKYTAELKTLYDSLKTAPDRRFEVYAVGYESDVPKWKRYIKDHELPFVNVGGPNVNIDYQEAYNVHGAPTMVILNEKRDIIMNKLIPINSILSFLDNYEKRIEKH
ncbi:MAG: DUF5106 domain-containing protein [Bacteroidales bacterium]|nr:DUF5106 domain-containing protein [Bacteroidales bacterium]